MITILPKVFSPKPWESDWREQFDRECEAVHRAMAEPPARTRPILIKPLIDGHRPEGERR